VRVIPPPPKKMTPWNELTIKTRFRCIERKATLLMVSCRCIEGTKKNISFLI